MKYPVFIFSFLLFTNKVLAADTLQRAFHNPAAYLVAQYSADNPTTTVIAWAYVKRLYIEARYNYEDRRTGSLYFGRSYQTGKHGELEIIPMLGAGIGRFTGVAPALTFVLEANWIRGFSQSQYAIETRKKESNCFINWTALVVQAYKPLYIGASLQNFSQQNTKSQLTVGPMVSVKAGKFFIEGFAYNVWANVPVYALGIQYNY